MPKFDGTGPQGLGPMTGYGQGYCVINIPDAPQNTGTTADSPNGHGWCLFCGDRNPRSLNLSFQATTDHMVWSKFQANPFLQGYDGILHGGVITSLLDAAMTHCLFHLGIQAVTGDLHVRFLHAVSCNATLEVRAWVLHSRPPLHRLKAEIVVAHRVMARAEAKFMQRRIEPMVKTNESDD